MSRFSSAWENLWSGVDSTFNWFGKGSEFASLVKVLGAVSTVVFGAAFVFYSAFSHLDGQNEQAYHSLFDAIDRGSEVQFSSASQCIALGYDKRACTNGEEAAKGWAERSETGQVYASKAECEAVFGPQNCREQTTPKTAGAIWGKITIPLCLNTTSYRPIVVGFQAAKKDIKSGVPLYPTATPGVAQRADGKLFSIKAP